MRKLCNKQAKSGFMDETYYCLPGRGGDERGRGEWPGGERTSALIGGAAHYAASSCAQVRLPQLWAMRAGHGLCELLSTSQGAACGCWQQSVYVYVTV